MSDADPPPVEEKTPVFVETIAEASKLIGVHERTLKSWLAIGAPERTEQGYDVEAIRSWRELNMKSGDAGFESPEDFKLRMAMAKLKEQEGKADKVSFEAELKDYQVREVSEDLLLKLDVCNTLSEALLAFRDELQKLPAQLSSGYPEIKFQLERDCRERIELSLRAIRSRLDKYVDPGE